ncbi:MAG: hypothetical protein ABI886_15750 [Betaproteobacteria bacterium]
MSSPLTQTVQAATGGGGTGFCAQYTAVGTQALAWGSLAQTASVQGLDGPGFYGEGVYVGTLTVPSYAPKSTTGYVAAAEYTGAPTSRHMTLSTQQCDFRPVDPTGVKGPFAESKGAWPSLNFSASGKPGVLPVLTQGQKYYVNIRNWDFDLNRQSCASGQFCDVLVSVKRP